MTKIISTISSASAGAGLAFGTLGEDALLTAVAGVAFGGVGYAIAFVGIPTLLKNKMLGMAVLLGFIMSLTWLMNGGAIYNMYLQTLCKKIDVKYPVYKKEYGETKTKKVDTGEKEKEIITLKYSIEKLKADTARLETETSKGGDSYRNIYDKSREYLYNIKQKNLREWKSGAYKRYAKKYLCNNPSHISFKRLVECKANLEFSKSVGEEIEELREKKTMLSTQLIQYKKITEEVLTAKGNAKSHNDSISSLYNKIQIIEKKATKEAGNAKLYIYGIIWAFGLFIELVSMMFGELVKSRVETITKKEIIKEIEEVHEEVTRREINRDCFKRMLDYARNENDPLRTKFKTKLKNGGRGKMLAISNSIMGAFLHAYSIRKNGIITITWKDVSQTDILYVNGSAGKETKNKKERRKLIEKFYPNIIEGEELMPIPTLGSTATSLVNKDINAYLGHRNGLNPQQEAIDFLVHLEETDYDRFSPLNLSVKDLELVAIKFVRRYHPNNF